MMDYRRNNVLAFALMGLGYKGFSARVLQIASHVLNFTHCIIHRENLASKALDQQ